MQCSGAAPQRGGNTQKSPALATQPYVTHASSDASCAAQIDYQRKRASRGDSGGEYHVRSSGSPAVPRPPDLRSVSGRVRSTTSPAAASLPARRLPSRSAALFARLGASARPAWRARSSGSSSVRSTSAALLAARACGAAPGGGTRTRLRLRFRAGSSQQKRSSRASSLVPVLAGEERAKSTGAARGGSR